jgi:flagellar biogenesis protein FliO
MSVLMGLTEDFKLNTNGRQPTKFLSFLLLLFFFLFIFYLVFRFLTNPHLAEDVKFSARARQSNCYCATMQRPFDHFSKSSKGKCF